MASRKLTILAAFGTNTASLVGTQIIALLRSMILARLLSPTEYGIFGMSAVAMAAVQIITSFNLSINVIRREFASDKERDTYLNTTWTVELAKQIITSLLMLAASWPAAAYFGNPRVFPVLVLCSLTPICTGLTNAGFVLLRREMQFRTIALHKIWSELLLTLFGIAVAVVTRDVWALATSQVLGALAATLLSYRMHPYRPKLEWNREVIRDSASFSLHLFIVSVLTYITTQFDNLIVGRYLGAASVAAYMLAYRLANLAAESTSEVLGPVLYPAVSQMQRETPEQVYPMFYLTFATSLTLLLAVTLPFRLASAWVVQFFYGAQWTSAAPLLALLVFVGALRGAARLIAPFFLALGKPQVESVSKMVEAPVFIVATLSLVPTMGAPGAAWAGILSYGLAFFIRFVRILSIFRSYRLPILNLFLRVTGSAAMSYGIGHGLLQTGLHPVLAILAFVVLFCILVLSIISVLRERVRQLLTATRTYVLKSA